MKHNKSEEYFRAVRQRQYGKRALEEAEANLVCVSCGGQAVAFRDDLSFREYGISGLCQICQDKAFRRQRDE